MFLLLRFLAAAVPVASLGGCLARWAATLPGPGSADFPTLLTALAAWTFVGGCVWALLLLAAAATEAGTRHRLRTTRLVPGPEAARRWALVLLGAAVVSMGPLPAYAGQGDAAPHEPTLGGLPAPHRPDGELPTHRAGSVSAPVGRPGGRPGTRRLVVRPGDSLWDLLTARLPSSADQHDVAAAVDATYRANRNAIGPDPDLIRPGQHLVVRLAPGRHHPTEEDR